MEGGWCGGHEVVAVSRRGSAARSGDYGGSTIACGGGGDGGSSGGNGDGRMVGARTGDGSGGSDGGGTDTCGGDNDGWTPSSTLREHPLKREENPFFSQMTARFWGGSLPLL